MVEVDPGTTPAKRPGMNRVKNRISFSKEAGFVHFRMINFYRSQMQCMFIDVNIS